MPRGALARLALVATLIGFALVLSMRGRTNATARAGGGDVAASTTAGTFARSGHVFAASVAVGGSISGEVIAPSGAPIAGALVCAEGSSPAIPDDALRDPFCATTDGAGQWSITNLPAATYILDASAPHWLPARFVDANGSTSIAVAADEARANVALTLAPGGVEVRGRVVDLAHEGIAYAVVTLTARGTGRGDGEARVMSDAAGFFLAWIAPGRFDARAESDGFVADGSDGIAPASRVEIMLSPAAKIIGRVVSADTGAPVEGATVTAEGANVDGWTGGAASTLSDVDGRFTLARLAAGRWFATAQIVATTGGAAMIGEASSSVQVGAGETSSEVTILLRPGHAVGGEVAIVSDDATSPPTPCIDGTVSFFDARRGSHFSASIDPRGHVATVVPFGGRYEVTVSCSDTIESGDATAIDVTGDALDNRWQVSAGRQIRGVVVDRDGHPLARVEVDAQAIGGRSRSSSYGDDTTAADGRFTIRGVEAGRYALDVTSDDAKSPPSQTVEVAASGAAPELRLVLDRGATIDGTVVDASGVAVGGVEVSVAATDDGERRPRRSSTTDETGHFVIGGVDDGDPTIEVSSEGAPLRGADGVEPATTRVKVLAPAVTTARLVVEAMSSELHGNVVDAAGNPVAGASIEVSRELGDDRLDRCAHLPARTDAAGKFVVRRLPNATFTVRARRGAGPSATAKHVSATAAATAPLTLTMGAGATLRGTVTDASGRAPDAISIHLTAVGPATPASARFTQSGGAWSMAGVEAGEYKLEIVSAEGEATESITVEEGDARAFVTTLAPIASVAGCVVFGDDGGVAAGVSVSVNGADADVDGASLATRSAMATTDRSGCFLLARAPVGTIALTFNDASTHEIVGRREAALGAGSTNVGVVRVLRRRDFDEPGDLGFTALAPGDEGAPTAWGVVDVALGRAADHAGLRVGDDIAEIDGVRVVGGASALYTTAIAVPIGAHVRLGLADGRSVTVIAGAPPIEDSERTPDPPGPDGDEPDETQ